MLDTKLNTVEWKRQHMGPVIGIIRFKMSVKHPSEAGRCQIGSEVKKPWGYMKGPGWRHKFGNVGLQMTFRGLRFDEITKGESLDYKEKTSWPEL